MASQDVETLQRNIELYQAVIREMFTTSILSAGMDVVLTAEQMKCLRFICCNDKVLVGQLAKGLRISYPAATKAISRLEEKKIVIREKDPLDRRNIYVSLTAKGVELADKIKAEKATRLNDIIRLMTEEQIEDFSKGLKAFLGAVLTENKLSETICLHCGKDHKDDCFALNTDCFCFL